MTELRQRAQVNSPIEDIPPEETGSDYSSSTKPHLNKKQKVTSYLDWNRLPFTALPEWLRDNEFIHGSYRPPMFSVRGCFKSMFRLHNETWNIWTHFIGFLFFVVLVAGVYIFGDYITGLFEDVQIHMLPWNEQLMLFLFFGGAIICLLCSTLFHVFHNHSKSVSYVFSRLDYSGIALLITGSSVPAYYYGFYCTWVSQYFHISIIVILCVPVHLHLNATELQWPTISCLQVCCLRSLWSVWHSSVYSHLPKRWVQCLL